MNLLHANNKLSDQTAHQPNGCSLSKTVDDLIMPHAKFQDSSWPI